jgi:N-acetylglucosamine-6-sulfatase
MRRGLTTTVVLMAVAGLGMAAANRTRGQAEAVTPRRPNVVLILADDLSWNLVNRRFTPHIAALQRRGMTFTRYFVTDSLCCPSRSTLFTGLLPHDSGVFTNLPPDGGYGKFRSAGLEQRTWAVALQRAGYRTSMLGKYLNGYGDPQMTADTAPVPPGWSDWHVSNATGYAEFNYLLNENGSVTSYGGPAGGCGTVATPDDYGVDVLADKATAFIGESAGGPFAVEAATFAPHAPFTPAPRNACDFPGLQEPRDPSFNTLNTHAPAWLAARRKLPPAQVARLDAAFRKRAQATEAVDRVVGDVEAALARHHLLDDTYIVFTSDNGFHLGQHRLAQGKQTAFDTDIRVPLVVAGPGVPRGRTSRAVTQNTDLYPTFAQLAGRTPGASVDGRSLLELLHPGPRTVPWRTVALVEHHGLTPTNDPDSDAGRRGGNPPTYEAIRLSAAHVPGFRRPLEAVYVEYANPAHEREFYDIRSDPYERHNIVASLSARQRAALHLILRRLATCHGTRACWAAGRPRLSRTA